MKPSSFDEFEAAQTRIQDRYKVTVEFVVDADCIESAEKNVLDLIQEGILTLVQQYDREPVNDYEFVEIERAEIDI